ncbi:SAV_2336 N-terminal domain-related protein [Streptomyces odontomachi]|uniref:SAV_2336 N-terminal domain-related protein n=1 Tax=Streptomyces odontomachi TaxID=2944940 RepID=UPI00210AFA37|nr:WD40 repeat domain-containing protein [Streptomyces sp. ODS25]
MPGPRETAPEQTLASAQLRDAIFQLLDLGSGGPLPEDLADALWIARIAGITAHSDSGSPAGAATPERIGQRDDTRQEEPPHPSVPSTRPGTGQPRKATESPTDSPRLKPSPGTAASPPTPPTRHTRRPDATPSTPAPRALTPTPTRTPHRPPVPSASSSSTTTIHPFVDAARTGSGRTRSAHEVKVAGPPALTGMLELARALRPLRQLADCAGPPVLDEAGTVQVSSEARLLLPVWRPADEPRFSVDLLVDTGATMAVWHRLAGELWTALERHGSFADVRCWALETDRPTPRLASFHRRSAVRRAAHRSGTRWDRPLDDSTGRRILLVLTDGVGPAWRGTELPGSLARLSRGRPAAALQVLPRRLWHRTALRAAPVQARIADPTIPVPVFRTPASESVSARATPGSARTMTGSTGATTGSTGATTGWLPVMELDGAWLAPWAHLVAGRASAWVSMLAAPLDGVARPPGSAPVSRRPPAATPAAERVARFRAGCSPNAYRLACRLAAAPLSLPVMRLVQAATVPDSGQTELAEIFLSGLIQRRHTASTDPDDVVYDFRSGVRDELLGEMTRRDSVWILEDVLAKVSGHTAATFGGTLDFRALAARVSGADTPGRSAARELPARSLPFAEVAATVLSDAAGRHGAVARQLAAAARGDAAMTSPPHPEFLTPPRPIGPLDPPHLIGRTTELNTLQATLQQTERGSPALAIIEGPPGVGRMRLIQEYLRHNGELHTFTHWIDARSPDSLEAGLVGLWRALGMAGPAGADVSTDRLWAELARYRGWLVILDGVPPEAWLLRYEEGDGVGDALPRYFPAYGRGCTVATTDSLNGWQHPNAKVIRLGELSRDDILGYLRWSLGDGLRSSDPYQRAELEELADGLPPRLHAQALVDLLDRLNTGAPPRPRRPILRADGTRTVWAVTSFAMPGHSPLLATANQDGTVRIWDPATGNQTSMYSGDRGSPVLSVTTFLLRGHPALAITGKDRTVLLLDPFTGRVVGRLTDDSRPTAPGPLRAVAPFELSGRILLASAGEDKLVQMWDPATGDLLGELTGHTASVQALTSFTSLDGSTLLATASHDRTVRIWDPETGTQLGEPFVGGTKPVWAVAAVSTRDGRRLLATAGPGWTIRVWDAYTRQTVCNLTGHTDSVWAVTAFAAPDGRPLLASAGHDRTVRIWDPETGTQLGAPLTGHTAAVLSVTAFVASGGRLLLASAGHDRTVRIWDPADRIGQ